MGSILTSSRTGCANNSNCSETCRSAMPAVAEVRGLSARDVSLDQVKWLGNLEELKCPLVRPHPQSAEHAQPPNVVLECFTRNAGNPKHARETCPVKQRVVCVIDR